VVFLGQDEVLKYLKLNPGKNFSAKEISDSIKLNIQTVYASLKKLESKHDIRSENLIVEPGSFGITERKVYFYVDDGDEFYCCWKEYENTMNKIRKRISYANSDVVMNILIFNELKNINKKLDKRE